MPDDRRTPREVWVLVAAQFGLAFSINYIVVFLPFYIRSVSRMTESATLVWTGLILAGSPAAAVFGSYMWATLTPRVSPKLLYERGLLTHGLVVGATAFTSSLPLLLVLRLVQGVLGGISTIALIIIGSVSRPAAVAAHIGLLNSALTIGSIAGPPVGAAIAAAAGFRAAFLSASLLIVGTLVFCDRLLPPVPPTGVPADAPRLSRRKLLAGWFVSVTATIQLVFLPSVLPQVLAGFGVRGQDAIAVAGLVVMAYGAASAVGAASLRWVSRFPHRPAVLAAGGLAAALQGALAFAGNLPLFVALRVLQALLAGLIMPLVMAEVAATGRGKAVGALNTARFVGNAAGPILATSLLARADLSALYLSISGAALISLGVLAVARPPSRH